jgi:lipopolysaccharide biosynthesis glycosyltransferase
MQFLRTRVFYTTDTGFAVPTLASIESLRRWTSANELRVSVVLLGMNAAETEAFERRSADLGIDTYGISAEALADFDNENFNQTHVPYTTLARFLIPQFIPPNEAAEILYLDGDTWLAQDPTMLLDIAAPDTGLLGCEDQSDFYADDFGETGRAVTTYFKNISVDRSKGYFNAGVLKFKSQEWARISDGCLAFLKNNLGICRYHDQSALNAVAGRTRVRLSPVWNFQTPYWDWGLDAIAAPKLLHFVGGAKPWMGTMKALESIYSDYTNVIRKRSDPLFPLKIWSSTEQRHESAHELRMRLKQRTIFYHRILGRRHHFKHLLATSVGVD